MATGISRRLKERIRRWNLPLVIQTWIFVLIMLFFQIFWESYEAEINTFPPLVAWSDAMGEFLLWITPAILNPLFNAGIAQEGISLILPNGFYVSYFFHLSGIKPVLIVLFMIVLLPGPWIRKVWYAPACVAVILFTVFLRFILLTIHCMIFPEHLHLIQIMLFGPMFYLEILVMWAAWVLLIARTARLKGYPEPDTTATSNRR